MSRCSRKAIFAALSILWCGASASAETLRCQAVNGNVNCAGSGGASCQTINGKKTCVSGHGDVVQSFGGGKTSVPDADAFDEGLGDASPDSATRRHLERRDMRGRTLRLDRDGAKIHIQNDWMSVDRE